MLRFVLTFCTIFGIISNTGVLSVSQTYYWREYTGVIPPDAFIAGKDISGEDVHVGQAYIKNSGVQVVPIYKGVKEVYAVVGGAKKIDRYIKILCGPQNNFGWLPTDAKSLHVDLIGKQVVIGGQRDTFGDLNIGRISYEGETKIGKVNAFSIGDAKMYFHDRGQEKRVDYPYEVLYYDENGVVDPRVA